MATEQEQKDAEAVAPVDDLTEKLKESLDQAERDERKPVERPTPVKPEAEKIEPAKPDPKVKAKPKDKAKPKPKDKAKPAPKTKEKAKLQAGEFEIELPAFPTRDKELPAAKQEQVTLRFFKPKKWKLMASGRNPRWWHAVDLDRLEESDETMCRTKVSSWLGRQEAEKNERPITCPWCLVRMTHCKATTPEAQKKLTDKVDAAKTKEKEAAAAAKEKTKAEAKKDEAKKEAVKAAA